MAETIEKHYNYLRERAKWTKAAIEPENLKTRRMVPDIGDDILRESRALVAQVACEVAELDWPRVIAARAEQHEKLRLNPVRFYVCESSSSNIGIGAMRESDSEESGYVDMAIERVMPELRARAQAAERQFEAYRQAIIQGVAVAPRPTPPPEHDSDSDDDSED